MLIKDNEGDWGVCVAVWRGMKKGVPGVPGKYLQDAHELKRPANISTHNDCTVCFSTLSLGLGLSCVGLDSTILKMIEFIFCGFL